MSFRKDDIYTSSGAVKFWNAWTPTVAKFDTSSFYNWEQDNLPLYDLEERTYELWEQAGFPTSSLNGFSLTVSADAPQASLDADTTIFTDLSSCIAALPRVIRFPVLIEVANFGDLGTLELNDIEMMEDGSIEIINRNFAKIYTASADVRAVVPKVVANGAVYMDQVSSLDLSNSITETSALAISSQVYSGASDSRLANNANVAVLPAVNLRRGHLSVGIGVPAFGTGTTDRFDLSPYDTGAASATGGDTTLEDADVTGLNQTDGTTPLWRGTGGVGDLVGGMFYGNSLTKIRVKNCNGPVYIRGFFADGGAAPHSNSNGIEVVNSDVVLENCMACRFEDAGFAFLNSRVNLSRSNFAFRNYTLSSSTVRQPRDQTAGFKFVNSEVILSGSTTSDSDASERDFVMCASRNTKGVVLENSTLRGGLDRSVITDELTRSHIQIELNSDIGIEAKNSIIDVKGLLDLYANKTSIDLDSSKLLFNELCIDSSNEVGLNAVNSKILYGSWLTSGTESATTRRQFDFSSNGQTIVLDGAKMDFARRDATPDFFGSFSVRNNHGYLQQGNYALPAIEVKNGGKADLIHLFNERTTTVSMKNDSVGYGLGLAALDNGSISCYGSKNHPTIIQGPLIAEKSFFTAGAFAKHGSTISFHGPTALLNFGVDVLAEDNSNVNFSPPYKDQKGAFDDVTFALSSLANHTSVELHSLRACLVADKGSTINLDNLGHYSNYWINTPNGVTAFGIQDDDVQNNLNVSSLCSHGSMQFYPNTNDLAVLTTTGTAENGANLVGTLTPASKFTQGNSINWLLVNSDPSANTVNFENVSYITSGGTCVRALGNSNIEVFNVHFPIGSTSGPTDGLYYDINTDDCHQLMIWNIGDDSKLKASYCSVSAMYPSEVGYHGPSAIYTSSSDGTANGVSAVAYGAPLGTPDTGNLSILDSFGAGSAIWYVPSGIGVNDPFDRFYPVQASSYDSSLKIVEAGMNYSGVAAYPYGATQVFNNQGVFRLYFSPHSSAKFLLVDASGYQKGGDYSTFSGMSNVAYQIFAQGYNMSANCSAIIPSTGDLSSLFPNLLKLSADNDGDGVNDTLAMSGFYYCKEFLEDNPTQCIVDESAANIFANAKNASWGGSGRPRRVTIYRASKTDAAGEGRENSVYGTGFKSSNVFDLRRYT